MNNALRTWLLEEIKRRRWSHSELARRAGVSQAAVSGTLSGDRKAGADFCIKIAQAVGESPEKVLRLAEILPPLTASDDPISAEIFELVKGMSIENRQDILQYVRFRYQQERD